jgi:hypothetical protein
MITAYLNRIATAVPEHDVHDAFVVFAEQMLAEPRLRTVFRRMVSRAGIEHRYSSLDPQKIWANPGRTTHRSSIRRRAGDQHQQQILPPKRLNSKNRRVRSESTATDPIRP